MALSNPAEDTPSGAPLGVVRALVEDLLVVVHDGKPRVLAAQLSRDLMHAQSIVTRLFRNPSTDSLDADTAAVLAPRAVSHDAIARRTAARCDYVRSLHSVPALAYVVLVDTLIMHLAEGCGAIVRSTLCRFDWEADAGVIALTTAVQRFDRIAHAVCLTVFRAVDKERDFHRLRLPGHEPSCECTGPRCPQDLLKVDCVSRFRGAFRQVLFDEVPQQETLRVRRWFARLLHDTWETAAAITSTTNDLVDAETETSSTPLPSAGGVRGANWAPFRSLVCDVFCSCGRGEAAEAWFCEAWAGGLLRLRCDAVTSTAGELAAAARPQVVGATVVQVWRCVTAVLTHLCGLPGTWREATARAAAEIVLPWLHTVLPLVVLTSREADDVASFSGAQQEVLAAAVRLEQLKLSPAAGDSPTPSPGCTSPWLEQLLRKALVASLRKLLLRCFDELDDVSVISATWPQKVGSGAGGGSWNLSLGRFLCELVEWLEDQVAALEGIVTAPATTTIRSAAAASWARALLTTAGNSVFKMAAVLFADALHVAAAPSSAVPCNGRVAVLEYAVEWVAERDLLLRCLSDRLQQRMLRAAPPPDDVLEAEWALVATLKRSAAVGGSSDGTLLLRSMERMVRDMQSQAGALDVGQLQQLLCEALPGELPVTGSEADTTAPKLRGCVQVHPVILRSTVWSSVSDISWIRTLPLELKVASRLVEDMYRRRWPQRRLSWSHLNSRCDVDVLYANGGRRSARVTVTLPLVGASILSYFDLRCTDSIEMREIGEVVVDDTAGGTNNSSSGAPMTLGDEERRTPLKAAVQQMRGMVQSLVALRILVEHRRAPAPDSTVPQCDLVALRVNRGFLCSRRRLCATVIGGGTSEAERRVLPSARSPLQGAPASADEKVVASRLAALKAAIVRVMKARREATHSDLFEAVKQQLAPLYDVRMDRFKEVLSTLMETDYIARAESADATSTSYVYLA